MPTPMMPCPCCALFIGLPDVRLLELEEEDGGLVMVIETDRSAFGCPTCGTRARVKDRSRVELVDLPFAGRPMKLIWVKRRLACVDLDCEMTTWTEHDDRIAPRRGSLSTRAGKWATLQVGDHGRSVSEVADDLSSSWHPVNDAVLSFGEALLDADTERVGPVRSLGLDEVAFAKLGDKRQLHFATTAVNTGSGQLLEVLPGRGGPATKAWIACQPEHWREGVEWASLDMSGAFRSIFASELPNATMVADPFHVVRHACSKVDECRRRVQNETLGHRGRKGDPLFRGRRLLTMAAERLDERGEAKRQTYLRAGDPRGEVADTWTAKEAVRELYRSANATTAGQWIDELISDMADTVWPVEVRSLGRTLKNWRNEIIAWHESHVTNGPTEAVNNLVKRVKRTAFGFRSFRAFRIRSLLYAGRPNWALLQAVTPR